MPHGPYPAPSLYRRLGVSSEASRGEILAAYRRLAHAAHPDLHPDDREASSKFRAITEAYEVLNNPTLRANYDESQVVEAGRAEPSSVAPSRQAARSHRANVPETVLIAGPVHVEAPEVGAVPSFEIDHLLRLMVAHLDQVLEAWWW